MNNLKREFFNYFTKEEKEEICRWPEYNIISGKNIESFIAIIGRLKAEYNNKANDYDKDKQMLKKQEEKIQKEIDEQQAELDAKRDSINRAKKEIEIIEQNHFEMAISKFYLYKLINETEREIANLNKFYSARNMNVLKSSLKSTRGYIEHLKTNLDYKKNQIERIDEWFFKKFCPPEEHQKVVEKKKFFKL